MKHSIIITALLAIALTACNKEEGDTAVTPTPEVAPAEGDTVINVPAPEAAAPANEGDTIVNVPAPADAAAPAAE